MRVDFYQLPDAIAIFQKPRRDSFHLSTIQDSFSFITIEEIKIPFSQYYDRKDTLQGRVLVWREKPVLAQAERARSPSGNPENFFWASSSSHLSTSTYTNNNSFDIKMKKKKSGWHTDVLGIVVVTLPPFDPGSSRGATQCIEIQTQEKQRSPLNDILLIHCDSQ